MSKNDMEKNNAIQSSDKKDSLIKDGAITLGRGIINDKGTIRLMVFK